MREYGNAGTIFADIDALNPRVEAYRPEQLPERQDELDEIYSALKPIEMGATPVNLLVYGETGQGKTVAVGLETSGIEQWAETQDDISVTVVTVQCKGLDKSYNALTHLVKELKEARLGAGEDLPVGYQRKQLLHMALDEMEEIGGTIIVILDEIDALGEDDYILYELPRATLEGANLSVIGITNDLTYTDNLEGDSRSSLGEDEVVFSPYRSQHLRAILCRRAAIALRDTEFMCTACNSLPCGHDTEQNEASFTSDILKDDVIPLCAAFAAEETGDARRALQLLYRATRFADDRGESTVGERHVREAHQYIEEKAVVTGLETLPNQKILSLMTVTFDTVRGTEPGDTTPLYNRYKKYCGSIGTDHRSKKRFRDFLNDLENQGLIRREPGRGQGKENKYWLDVDVELVLEHLPHDDRLGKIADNLRDKA